MATPQYKYILLNTVGAGTWTVPADWNSNANIIHLIGGGGAGTAVANSIGGIGSGGGGYTRIVNYTATTNSSISYTVGAGAVDKVDPSGGSTTFDVYTAGGGSSAYTGSGAGGIGSTYNGGTCNLNNNGGGGAAGPYGPGGNPSNAGGVGDAGYGGAAGSNSAGGAGLEIYPGIAGAGGGASFLSSGVFGYSGGLYGGGGGSVSGLSRNRGGNGAQGVIIIQYMPVQSGYFKDDPILGTIDLDDEFITDAWLVDQFVGNNLFAWGINGNGQLGNGTTINYSSPIQIGSQTNWKQVVFDGGTSGFAIKTDGTLWSWGSNAGGQLGKGTTDDVLSPSQVGSLTNWKQVTTSLSQSTLAIKTDGTLWGWGLNSRGDLGNGTTRNYSSPIQIGSLTNWKQVVSTYSGTNMSGATAIKTDGTLWAWGGNQYGNLGNGTTISYSSPIQIGSLTNWKQVAAGGTGCLAAIKTDGTLWSWGQNNNGQLGNGTTIGYSSPIQIGSLTNWKQVAAGYLVTQAIKTDGSLWAWGNNTYGQLGKNTTINYSSPIQIGSQTNWKQVSAGTNFTTAIKTDGTLWAWGWSRYGNIGNNTTVYYSSPIQIGSLTNWKQVSCGSYNTIAIKFADIT